MLATLIHISNIPLYDTEKPYKLYTPTGTITNCQYTNEQVVVEDARGREAEFDIDKCGFEFVKHKSNHLPSSEKLQEADFKDPEVMDFLQQTVDWAKDHFGASRVFCVDWRLRNNSTTAVNIIKEDDDLENIRRKALAPVANMHCDYSNRGGWERVQKHLLPHELSAIKMREDRIRIVNVWRPLKLVQDAPLVLCDRRSISPQDLLPVDQIVQNSITEEGLLLKHNKNHRWFWYSLQTPDDLAVFHTWDSEASDTVANDYGINYSPHGASLRAPVIEDALPRESVEVRIIVVTPKVAKD